MIRAYLLFVPTTSRFKPSRTRFIPLTSHPSHYTVTAELPKVQLDWWCARLFFSSRAWQVQVPLRARLEIPVLLLNYRTSASTEGTELMCGLEKNFAGFWLSFNFFPPFYKFFNNESSRSSAFNNSCCKKWNRHQGCFELSDDREEFSQSNPPSLPKVVQAQGSRPKLNRRP